MHYHVLITLEEDTLYDDIIQAKNEIGMKRKVATILKGLPQFLEKTQHHERKWDKTGWGWGLADRYMKYWGPEQNGWSFKEYRAPDYTARIDVVEASGKSKWVRSRIGDIAYHLKSALKEFELKTDQKEEDRREEINAMLRELCPIDLREEVTGLLEKIEFARETLNKRINELDEVTE